MTNGTSGRVSEASCLSRSPPPSPELSQTPFLTGLPGAQSKDRQMAPGSGPARTQGPLGPWNKFQMALRNSTWSPEWTPTWKKGPLSNGI
ncbi:hypothetical protein CRG98_012123 [Punica granatum]|uniref:Uncharacterized protein n=1 Tax=Punica granatum TaxID=22663 RepID=A0A2I0KGB2_PUNGR|nr:hypothetical protein CRG98_012123 [Punica granatum]